MQSSWAFPSLRRQPRTRPTLNRLSWRWRPRSRTEWVLRLHLLMVLVASTSIPRQDQWNSRGLVAAKDRRRYDDDDPFEKKKSLSLPLFSPPPPSSSFLLSQQQMIRDPPSFSATPNRETTKSSFYFYLHTHSTALKKEQNRTSWSWIRSCVYVVCNKIPSIFSSSRFPSFSLLLKYFVLFVFSCGPSTPFFSLHNYIMNE